MSLSTKANELHSKMTEHSLDMLFKEDDLMALIEVSTAPELLQYTQELLNNNLIKILKQGDALMFQAITTNEANKISSMAEDEAMIYSYIESSGREGIWTKTIKAKTNLHQHIVMRCLKSLENQRYIKSIKSVKHPTRKIYMLYNLQPSIDVTGGPWFTDSELDSEFIDSLTTVIWRFIANKTYPSAFQPPSHNINPLQASYPHNYTGYVDINNIMDFIISSKITNIELAPNDIRSLCDVLVYEDKLESIELADQYKATWQSIVDGGFINVDKDQEFSIFNNKSENVIDEEEEDLVYFDSWVHN